jgi:predicted RNase H-like HicB family nuclease
MSEPTIAAAAVPSPPGVGAPPPPAARRTVTVNVMVRLQGIAIPEADGGFSVVVPALPGCVTQGDTIEEVQANVVEAAEGWLESQHDRHKDRAVTDMLG